MTGNQQKGLASLAGQGRAMSGTIVMGALVGAVLGGVFGMVRGKTVRNKKAPSRPSDDLGYEWDRVRTDHDLCEFLGRLKAFRHASEEHYRIVGDACDDMVDLMLLLHDPTVPTQALWQTKSFRYVKRVGDALAALSDAVVEARRLAGARLVTQHISSQRRSDPGAPSGDMAEFEVCAGGIYGIMENYHASIARTIAVRGGGGGAATAFVQRTGQNGEDDDGDEGLDSDMDSSYSDDEDDDDDDGDYEDDSDGYVEG